MRLTILLALLLAPVCAPAYQITFGRTVDSPQGRYAQSRLRDAAPPAMSADPPLRVDLEIDPELGAEAYSVSSTRHGITIAGGDPRGLIYGALEAREQLRNWVRPDKVRARSRTPRLAFRGIKPAPTEASAAVNTELAKFPPLLTRMLDYPGAFYALRVEPVKTSHQYGEPILVRVTVQNISEFDLTVGADGIIRDGLWFDAQQRGISSQPFPGIAFDRLAGPVVLPVNYVVYEGGVLFRTSPHNSIARHVRGSKAAFEVDEIDDFTQSGWSVLLSGTAELVEDVHGLPSESRPVPWAEGTRSLHVRVRPRSITGRRLFPS